MKTQLMERIDISCKSEFDPPPLLEITVEVETVGLKNDKGIIEKKAFTKSGGRV